MFLIEPLVLPSFPTNGSMKEKSTFQGTEKKGDLTVKRLVWFCVVSVFLVGICFAQGFRMPSDISSRQQPSNVSPVPTQPPPSSGGYTPPSDTSRSSGKYLPDGRYTDAEITRMAVRNDCSRQCRRVKAGPDLDECEKWCDRTYGR